MTHSIKALRIAFGIAVITTALASRVHAVQITGAINFTGSGSASVVGNTTNIHFNNPFTVIGGTGSYTGTTGAGNTVQFTDFSFTGNGNSNNAMLVGAPILNEWSFVFNGRTYSFDLAFLDPNNSQVATNGSSMSLQGTGTLRISGGGPTFDPTFGSFALSGAGSSFQFQFLNATSSSLPEGGSALAFLGISLVGLEIFRRRLVRA